MLGNRGLGSNDGHQKIQDNDGSGFKCTEENKVISKAFYTVLSVNCEGKKDVLGLYISENEGANFY